MIKVKMKDPSKGIGRFTISNTALIKFKEIGIRFNPKNGEAVIRTIHRDDDVIDLRGRCADRQREEAERTKRAS